MLRPSENCPDFFAFFIGSIEPGADNRDFYQSCSPLIVDLVERDALPSDLARFTRVFLTEWFPVVVTKIAGLRSPAAWEETHAMAFFKDCAPIIPWAYAHDLVALFPTLIQMFTYRAPNAEFISAAVDHEFLSVMAFRLGAVPVRATLDHFHLFLVFFRGLLDFLSEAARARAKGMRDSSIRARTRTSAPSRSSRLRRS